MQPNEDRLQRDAVEHLDPEAPVTMLNLLRFRAASIDGNGTGWDAYVRYSALTMPLIKSRGGTVIWAGKVRGTAFGCCADGEWDYAVLVRYPSPTAFLDMVDSSEYAQGNHHRLNGLERHVILATHETYHRQPPATG
ncbi:DUF1330 domain-containing protein [Mangrovimicrobium sediminis]|uniref:DUF1330 domain-containing protein n=1 Tax=Mangrovimicrobium sediminis TaxID=2562682 RepID=A0A4Z0M2W8_9GAMM|nr:DUF1330 domain-containing protein [Haliea sp. SAOS-164]TGD73625.1 DUF1330 domain-containing protein [Haliea sp. SAOS-164]